MLRIRNKIYPLMFGFCIIISLFFSSFGESNDLLGPHEEYETSGSHAFTQVSTDQYSPNNVYYLNGFGHLSGLPDYSDGSDANDIRKCSLVNGAPAPFYYPPPGKRPAKLVRNSNLRPFISLIINSFEDSGKTVQATLGIDTNDHFDPHEINTLEHRCEFPAYQTIGNRDDGTMEEEYYQAYGQWQGGSPPSVIEKGRLILVIIMTSPNGNPAILYCGFNYKASWFFCPYEHTCLDPHAEIAKKSLAQGFEEYGNPNIYAGQTVTFDGSNSYDPNDDINGNEKIDTYLGEMDRLKYKWNWGDGTQSGFAYDNKIAVHRYSMADIPLKTKYVEYYVTMSVMDYDGFIDQDDTFIRIFRGDNSPEITSIKINDVEQYPSPESEVRSILDRNIKVWFSAEATDKDDDELSYYWNFDHDPEYEEFGSASQAATVYYTFHESRFQEGKHRINLTVSDGTLAANATTSCYIILQKNVAPVPIITAQNQADPRFYTNTITVKINEPVMFYANRSYDPDNLPGFDTNFDNKTDFQLRYRWNFDWQDPSATTDWLVTDSIEYTYYSSSSYQYEVILEVDDGFELNTSEPFIVKLNVPPKAKIRLDSGSYNPKGNLLQNKPVYFNGSGSYDPNGDKILNYTWKICGGEYIIKKYGQTMTHSFVDGGEHQVTLVVYDGTFWSESYEIKVELPKQNKSEKYEIEPLIVTTGEPVYYNITETDDKISNNRLRFKWYFGDGNSKLATKRSTIYEYTKPGLYSITFEVEDEFGYIYTYHDILITVRNRPPRATIKELRAVDIGEPVQLSGIESFDPDGMITTYIWTFGDGSDEVWTNESQIEHTWQKAGTYTIELTVQDNFGESDVAQIRIIVKAENEKVESMNGLILIEMLLGFNIIIIMTIVILILSRRKWKGYLVKRTE